MRLWPEATPNDAQVRVGEAGGGGAFNVRRGLGNEEDLAPIIVRR